MTEYCQGKSKARVNFTNSKGVKETVVADAPVIVRCGSGSVNSADFSHNMKAPIFKTFDRQITGIENIGGIWNADAQSPGLYPDLPCPMPGTIPVHQVRPDVDAKTMIITGNRLECEFDLAGFYFDNGGVCSYRVSFGKVVFKVISNSKLVYQEEFSKCPAFTVGCDDDCPPHHIRCETISHPGYCCLSCKEVAQRINNLAARI